VVPAALPKKLRRSPNLVVEVDAMPGGYVCSASMKNPATAVDARAVAGGTERIRKLFSKEQRALYDEHAPAGIALDDLAVLGPILVFKLKAVPPGLGRKTVVELWHYPDASQVIELSTRTAPDQTFQVAAEMRAFLTTRGVSLEGEQRTKTRAALEFYAQRLRD
jgi:hypothetical protein